MGQGVFWTCCQNVAGQRAMRRSPDLRNMRSPQAANSPLPAFVPQRGHTGSRQGRYPGTGACKAALSPAALSALSRPHLWSWTRTDFTPWFPAGRRVPRCSGSRFPRCTGKHWALGRRERQEHTSCRQAQQRCSPRSLIHPAPLLSRAFLPGSAAGNFVINTLIRQCTGTAVHQRVKENMVISYQFPDPQRVIQQLRVITLRESWRSI